MLDVPVQKQRESFKVNLAICLEQVAGGDRPFRRGFLAASRASQTEAEHPEQHNTPGSRAPRVMVTQCAPDPRSESLEIPYVVHAVTLTLRHTNTLHL